jgi:predicted RNase H-like HicB family nuclease
MLRNPVISDASVFVRLRYNETQTTNEGDQITREFTVIIEQDEDDYYVASVPELPGCHTQARSPDQLLERMREAILLCEVMTEDEGGRLGA